MPFVAGFGSLMFPYGVNGRGINLQYMKEDLVLADLIGYKRTYEASINGRRFLGITKDEIEERKINITVFYVPIGGWDNFLQSESSHPDQVKRNPDMFPLYKLVDVSENIRWRTSPFTRDPIYTCVTSRPSGEGKVPKEYHERIMHGIELFWGKEELEYFMKTTYWKEGNTVWDTKDDKKKKVKKNNVIVQTIRNLDDMLSGDCGDDDNIGNTICSGDDDPDNDWEARLARAAINRKRIGEPYNGN